VVGDLFQFYLFNRLLKCCHGVIRPTMMTMSGGHISAVAEIISMIIV